MKIFVTVFGALIITASLPQPVAAAELCQPPQPIVKTLLPPPYPTASQRDDETGTTMFTVTVAPDGKPTGIVVNRSSGSERLDEAASSFAISHYRWESFQESCHAGQIPFSVIWKLGNPPKVDGAVLVPISNYPPDALRLEEMGDVYLTLSVGDGGTVKDIRVSSSSGYADLDSQSVEISEVSPNLTAGKRPGEITLLFRWRLTPELNKTRITISAQAMHLQDAIEDMRRRDAAACGQSPCRN